MLDVRDVGGQVEDDFLALGLGGRGEVAEGLLVHGEAAGVDVGVESREQRRGALAQGGGAVGRELQDAAESGLGFLELVDAGELDLVAPHAELAPVRPPCRPRDG